MEKVNLRNKTLCVVDNGQFTSFAQMLSRSFGRTFYYSPWQEAMVKNRRLHVGEGMEGIEKVRYPMDYVDKVDLWVFLDLHQPDLQCFLERSGCRVWGTRYGEELELDRLHMKEYLRKVGLSAGEYLTVKGIDALRDLMKNRKGFFVKANLSRDFETFHHQDYLLSRTWLAEREYDLGPLASDLSFLCEDEIKEAVEIGYDGPSVDGKFPSIAMQGFEVKDCGLIGTVKPYEKLATPVKLVNGKLAAALKGYNYRSNLCTEIRYTRNKEAHLIDFTARLGSPSNELQQEIMSGWAEFMWLGAEGVLGELTQVARYGAIIMCESKEERFVWTPIEVPKSVEKWVKVLYPYRSRNQLWAVPQDTPQNLLAVVGLGGTIKEAITVAKEHAEEVKGFSLDFQEGSVDKAQEVIEKAREYGIEF